MTERIRVSEPTVPRIRTTEPAVRRLDPGAVAQALGAEPCPDRLQGPLGPITLYALRQELLRRRHSGGGRPGIEGTSFRAKIPLGNPDWQRLEALAADMSADGFSPSPGQVASILLSLALRSLTHDLQPSPSDQAGPSAAFAKEPATRLTSEKSR